VACGDGPFCAELGLPAGVVAALRGEAPAPGGAVFAPGFCGAAALPFSGASFCGAFCGAPFWAAGCDAFCGATFWAGFAADFGAGFAADFDAKADPFCAAAADFVEAFSARRPSVLDSLFNSPLVIWTCGSNVGFVMGLMAAFLE
jgi:hypothetical protein